MQNLDNLPIFNAIAMDDAVHNEQELELLFVFKLLVPDAAKVPAPRPISELGAILVRESAITSTVPGQIYIQLRANNTARSAAWCCTATLAAPQARPTSRA